MTEPVVNSSGNVFVDLGYSPDEAAILQMRADLMADLRKFIKAKKLTQAKAAQILGVSQSRVSDLTRGKWEKFSLEMLIILATKAGMRVSLKTAAQETDSHAPPFPTLNRYRGTGRRDYGMSPLDVP